MVIVHVQHKHEMKKRHCDSLIMNVYTICLMHSLSNQLILCRKVIVLNIFLILSTFADFQLDWQINNRSDLHNTQLAPMGPVASKG